MKYSGYKMVKKEGAFDEFTFAVASDENNGSIRLINKKTGESNLVKSLEIFGLGEALYRRVFKDGVKNVYMPLSASPYRGEGQLNLYLPCITSDKKFIILVVKGYGYSRLLDYMKENNYDFGFTKVSVKQYKNTKSFYAYSFETTKEFSLDIPKDVEVLINKYISIYNKITSEFGKGSDDLDEIGI